MRTGVRSINLRLPISEGSGILQAELSLQTGTYSCPHSVLLHIHFVIGVDVGKMVTVESV